MSSPCHNRPTLLLPLLIPEGGHRWRCAICGYEGVLERVGETAVFRAPEHERAVSRPSERAQDQAHAMLTREGLDPDLQRGIRDRLQVEISGAIDAAEQRGRDAERTAIVAWLRVEREAWFDQWLKVANTDTNLGRLDAVQLCADAIEAGNHHPVKP